jgi:Ca2+/H+ antiporter
MFLQGAMALGEVAWGLILIIIIIYIPFIFLAKRTIYGPRKISLEKWAIACILAIVLLFTLIALAIGIGYLFFFSESLG